MSQQTVFDLMRALNLADHTGYPVCAVKMLRWLGERAAAAVPKLLQTLEQRIACNSSDDIRLRAAILEALGEIGEPAELAIPILIELLQHGSEASDRAGAAVALARLKPEAAMPHLIEALRQDDTEVQIAAAKSLGMMGRSASEAVSDLVDILNDKECLIREEIIESLGQIGPPAQEAIPLLESILRRSETEEERCAAAEALGELRSASSVQYLIEAFQTDCEPVRVAAARAFGRLGEAAAAAVPHLAAVLCGTLPPYCDADIEHACAEGLQKSVPHLKPP